VTESAHDLAQHFIDAALPLPPHQVEASMSIKDVLMRGRADAPSKLLQEYVDNFCYAATQSKDGDHIPTYRRAAIHGIEALFPPPAITKHKDGKEPISVSKLKKGDGNFELKKDMIGFRFNGSGWCGHLSWPVHVLGIFLIERFPVQLVFPYAWDIPPPAGYPSAQGKYRNIPRCTIPTV
jgi:hypothetical protein